MAEVFGILYFALCLYPAIPVRYDFGDETSLHWTLLMLILIWVGDTAALAVGKTLGKTPLAPVLSPKKTYEGAVGGLLAGVGISIAAQQLLFPDLPLPACDPALCCWEFSANSRSRGIHVEKSRGNGTAPISFRTRQVLDRMDSLLFAFPVLAATCPCFTQRRLGTIIVSPIPVRLYARIAALRLTSMVISPRPTGSSAPTRSEYLKSAGEIPRRGSAAAKPAAREPDRTGVP
jgi:hypothetical protein